MGRFNGTFFSSWSVSRTMAANGGVCAALIRHKATLLRELCDTNVLDVLVKKGLFSLNDFELITSALDTEKCNYFVEVVSKQSGAKLSELCSVLEKECPALYKELMDDKRNFILNGYAIDSAKDNMVMSHNINRESPRSRRSMSQCSCPSRRSSVAASPLPPLNNTMEMYVEPVVEDGRRNPYGTVRSLVPLAARATPLAPSIEELMFSPPYFYHIPPPPQSLNTYPGRKRRKRVVLIFGINGACRTGELLNIKTEDITECDNHLLLINLPDTKTRRERSFVIRSSYAEIVKKYLNLRPPNMKTDRFFINYFNGKCTRQVIGKNKISAMPKKIAEYLKLPNPELYTGHCLRRTSATLLAESGADMTQIKRHGGWRSDAVAEGYVENSLQNKNDISCRIGTSIKLKNIQCSLDNMRSTVPQPSTSAHIEQVPSPPKPSTSTTAPFLQAPPSPTYTVEDNLQSQTHNMAATESETYTQFNSMSSTAINKPNKNITLSFHNWTNVSNITFNF